MDDDCSHDLAADKVDQCIDAFDDEQFDTITGDSGRIIGWVIERVGSRIIIERDDELPSFSVTYNDDPIAMVGNIIPEGKANIILEDVDERPPGRDGICEEAAVVLLESVSDEVLEKFAYELIQLLSNQNMFFNVEFTEGGAIDWYYIGQPIYPHSDQFTKKEYDQAVQSAATIGEAARLFVSQSLDVESAVYDHLDEPPKIAFQ